jgi:large subunit ribosomal protein L10
MAQYLNGMNAFAVSESDPIAAAKILREYAEKIETFSIVAGFVDGKVIDAKQVEDLAKTPSKEVLLGRLLGSIQGPLYSLARVLTAITEKDGEAPAEAAAE